MNNSAIENKKLKNKKRLMYIASEDFYLYTYSIFNILSTLECVNSESMFFDHRKLPFYIYFSSDGKIADIYKRYKKREAEINYEDRRLLVDCYYNSISKDKMIYRLLLILEKEGYIGVEKDPKNNSLNLYLKENSNISSFTDNPLFEKERKNILLVKEFYKNGHKVKFETSLNSLFYKFKVGNWLL